MGKIWVDGGYRGPIADVHLFAVMGMDRRDGRYGGRFRRELRDIRPLLGELQRVWEVWGGLWVDRPLGRPIADVHLFAVLGMDRRDGRYGGMFRRERRDILPTLRAAKSDMGQMWGVELLGAPRGISYLLRRRITYSGKLNGFNSI